MTDRLLRLSRRTLVQQTAASAFALLGARSPADDLEPTRSRSAEQAEGLVEFPPIDFAGVARKIVTSLHPQMGERAVLLFDPTYYPQLATESEMALRQAGVDPVLRITFPPLEVPFPTDPQGIRKSEKAWDDMLGSLFDRVDLLLVLPGRNQPPDLRWERLLNASAARCIHCHFVLPMIGARCAADVVYLCELYAYAILNSDYPAMSRTMDKIVAQVRGTRLRVTSAAGTDLEIDVAADAWFHKSDGDLPKERAARAVAVRDREIEHPGGALRVIPHHDSAKGMLVTQVSVAGVLTRVRMIIRGGVVISAKADGDDASFQKLWGSFGGDIDKISEIVIGTNPLLAGELPSGELPYAGYGAGALRISFGENWESGGTLRAGMGDPLWTFVQKATVKAGAVTVIRDGMLVT
jgi:hypothetical protein